MERMERTPQPPAALPPLTLYRDTATSAGFSPCAGHLPDCGVHAAVIKLLVVELSEEREQHLDASYGVDGAVDGVRDDGLHVLQVVGGWGGRTLALASGREGKSARWAFCTQAQD